MTASSRGGGLDDVSDYEQRLNEASAARARIVSNRAKRDEKRRKLEADYNKAISDMKGRIDEMYGQYRAKLTSLHQARLARCARAIQKRRAIEEKIAATLRDVQKLTDDFGVQLLDLYEQRRKVVLELGQTKTDTRTKVAKATEARRKKA